MRFESRWSFDSGRIRQLPQVKLGAGPRFHVVPQDNGRSLSVFTLPYIVLLSFCRPIADSIDIVRILHERMDFARHIPQSRCADPLTTLC
jgi:hypothetical protein